MRFGGRVALVTGSGRGIGRATSIEFARHGAVVVANDFDEDLLAETAALLDAEGARFSTEVADVTDQGAVSNMVERATRDHGQIDILVNNVGGAPPGAVWNEFRNSTVAEVQRFIDLNLGSALVCTRAVIEGMIEREYGKVVCVSSVSGVLGQMRGVGYATAKAALSGFVSSLAKEVAPHGVNVNGVIIGNAPHPSRTPEREAFLRELSHFNRIGRPEEFARAILFLASEDASYMSGTLLPIDGGYLKFALT